jgi:GAF domain-containing protein
MLERAVGLCEFDFALLWTYDGSAFHPVARHRLPDPFWAYLQDHTPPFFARLVDGERLVQIADIRDEAIAQTDFGREVIRLGLETVRSVLIVPLRKGGVLLGLIATYRQEVRPFSDKQIALLENFAAQAVIAMDNARLITETREALDQQTATAEVLQVINSSPGDLAPVFDAMLERAVRLCEFDFSVLWTFDGRAFHPVARHGVPERFWQYLRDHTPPAFARVLAGERLVHIPDLQQIPLYSESEFARDLRELHLDLPRSVLIVPLRKDEALLGLTVAYRLEVRPFSDKQIALLQNFAAQAVIAMENARLLTETHDALEQQTATAEVLGVINSSPGDLAPVFDAMLEKATRLCEASFGILWIFDGELASAGALHQVPEAYAELCRAPFRPSPGSGPARIMQGEDSFAIADLAAYPPYQAGDALTRAIVDLGGARSVVIAPLRRDDITLGAITIYQKELRPFSDKQIALLQNFAAQAVIAMENARLLGETREALEQQTATAEVLQVINASPGDLAPVFDAMLDKAVRLCEAAYGHLLTYDGTSFRVVAARGAVPEAFAEVVERPFESPPTSPLGRLVDGERLIHIADLADLATRLPEARILRAAVELGGIRTQLMVPLRKDDGLLGVIIAFRQEVRPFSDKQIALLENFAAQAVIAMENARLLGETREALEQQTATAEVLQVINSSPGDLAPVFDAMLEKAMRLCGAAFGRLLIYDGLQVRFAASRGVPPAFDEYRAKNPQAFGPGTGPARIIAGERVIHILDLKDTDSFRNGDLNRRSLVELGGARTALLVALVKDDAVLGNFMIYRQEVRPFSDKQIALLQNFAAQAVIAMENARLISETREALEQQTATAEVLQVINSSPGDLAPVFDAMLEKAMRLCGAAFGMMSTYDGERFHTGAMRGVPEKYAEQHTRNPPHPGPETGLGRIERGEDIVQIIDLADSDAYRSGDPRRRDVVDLGGARSYVAVALRKDGRLLGTIAAYRQDVRPFTDKQIALLQNFAAQAVIAMENARLLGETREALEQQTATAEVLQVINSSPGDLAPVFDAMLDKAMRLCEAPFGVMLRFHDARFTVAASRDVPAPFHDYLRSVEYQPQGGVMLARLQSGEPYVHTINMKDDDAYRSGAPLRRAAVDLAGARTGFFVSLRKDGELLGTFNLWRTELRPFTDKQIALLENFAAQAVIAMENARLLGELRARTDEIAGWNRELEARVAAQLAELERTGRLKRFLAPQLAELIVAQGDESILESHRREIVVVFCDIRGFTAFAERAEPEEVMALLRDYHAALGPIVARFEGTLDHYGGDGIMVFFNDPLPTPEPAKRAIEMAVAMREAAAELVKAWRGHGHDVGFGVGISQGYATLGQIGFAERMDYTAIGTVTNLAARLCDQAKDGQILISRRVATAVGNTTSLEEVGDLSLKGLSQAVAVYNVAQ